MSTGNPGYSYNASAIGFGGVLYRGGLKTVVPTVASVCLSPSGGEASVCYDNYYRDDISFSRAETRVSGGEASPVNGRRRHITYSEVYLRNLRIFDRIRIELMQATMTSTREITGDEPPLELEHDRTSFDIHVIYRGVELDGVPVGPDIDIDLCSARNYQSFADAILNRPDFDQLLANDHPCLSRGDLVKIKDARKPFIGPLVRGIGNVPAGRAKGPNVKLDKFGKVKFGQLLVTPDKQRYNLLRLELDQDWTTGQQPFLPLTEDAMPIADGLQALAFDISESSGGSLSGGGGGSNGVPTYP